jgi:RNA polymerase sigma factor (sigma-70 family)
MPSPEKCEPGHTSPSPAVRGREPVTGMTQERLERFEANRRRLFGVAYRLLGEASGAEDVVQDAYLRWERSDTAVSPEAWLTKVVTNLCLDRLTSARAQRERYVGTWLPEPVVTGGGALDPLETVEQRESLSLGMLVLLERLTPPERAVFVLRQAFGHSHREVAEILEVNEPHARQLYRRAQQHVAAARKRFTAPPGQRRELLERFLEATLAGDVPRWSGCWPRTWWPGPMAAARHRPCGVRWAAGNRSCAPCSP